MLIPFHAPVISLSYTYDSNQMDGNNAASYTYNNQTIGTGDWLIISASYNDGGGVAISGITVNGSPMTLVSENTAGDKQSFWRITHPGGATANIIITPASSCNRGCIGVYSLRGTPSTWTPGDTFVQGTDTTIDIYSYGVAFGVSVDTNNAAADTWSAGLTADASAQLGADSASGIVASVQSTTTQTGATCTCSVNGAYAISLRGA